MRSVCRTSRALIPILAVLVTAAWICFPRQALGATGFFHRLGDPYPRIVQQVFYYVEKKYVEPERASPRALLDGAFEALENQYPEVLVEPAGDGRVRIRVDRAEKTFDLTQAREYRKAADILATALRFVHQNLGDEVEEQDLYYAALNGALTKLDPHSSAFSPKMFKEFMIGTRGTFGGIGFVFGIRDGEMTIISVIEGTPAERGGLRSGDRILYIDGEPTINMPVDVAANKMRGEPGTQVTLTIDREGWPEPRAITFTREVIHVDSVESYVLTEGEGAPVLVARVKNFQKDTTDELRKAVSEALKAHPDLKGLVVDLRNNPGGLLDQAIELSDAFLEQGTIVSTRGPEKDANSRAEAGDDDPEIFEGPVALLVNQGSASASEIVSGALKASRALVIGQKTFGKGSVQKLYPLTDGGALKLTVAQYLTPGDVSIQSIGIQPDVVVYPARIEKGRMRIGPPPAHVAEADLENAFKDWGNASEKPWAELQYLAPEPEEDEKPFSELSKEEKAQRLAKDFEVGLARRVLAAAEGRDRGALLAAAQRVIPVVRAEEDRKISQALAALGIDWSEGPGGAGLLVVAPQDTELVPGETVTLRFTVANPGTEPVHRVWGRTDSENLLLKNLDFVFGRLGPGERKEAVAEVEVPKSALPRWDTVTLKLHAAGTDEAGAGAGAAHVVPVPRPEFAYRYRMRDENRAVPARSGDGRIEEGERIQLVLEVANRGEGASGPVEVNIRGEEKEQLYLEKARHRFDGLAPGEVINAPMEFRLVRAEESGDVKVGVSITDRDFGAFFSDELEFRVGEPYPAREPREPPRLAAEGPPLRTDAERVAFEIEVSDDGAVRDVYAYRERDKVVYRRNPDDSDRMKVRVEVPLEEGSNRITVVARDEKKIVATRTFFVYRTKPGEPGTELTQNLQSNP
ncbi:MAG: hypothetical protein Kow0054_05410 [Deferrisoma sp.]